MKMQNYIFASILFSSILLCCSASPHRTKEIPWPGNITSVQFILWTRSNIGNEDYFLLDPFNSSSLQESGFDDSLDTYFMFHGMSGSAFQSWITEAKTAILALMPANIIAVNYADMVISPYYIQAVENVYKVGNLSAHVIDWLVAETELQTNNINLIGHSLGSQSAGMTGQYVTSGQISKIIGMDPAGPLFWNRTAEHRLDASDAAFVVIMHSNSGPVYDGCMGMVGPLGHVDFYPNGGHHQPGCAPPIPGGDIIDMIEDCSHMRSASWFIESLTLLGPDDMKYKAWPCANYDDYQAGLCQDCGDGCLEMGFFTEPGLNGTYYLRTKAFAPYAMGDQQ